MPTRQKSLLSLRWGTFGIVALFMFTLPARGSNAVDFDPFGSEKTTVSELSTSANLQGPVIPTVAFTNNDITMAFQIISDATGWSIFPTPEVSRARVSLWAKKISAGELLDTIVTMAGFIYHRRGNVITVMTYPEYMQYYGLARTELKPKYAQAESLAAVIKPFLTKLGKCVIHKQTNSLILYDTDANLEVIIPVVENLDKPVDNTIMEVINLKHTDCEKLAQILSEVFAQPKGKEPVNKSILVREDTDSGSTQKTAPSSGIDNKKELLALSFETVMIYPVAHANQLIITGFKQDVDRVKHLVAKIDIANDNMALEVIDIEYADAEEMARTLQNIFSEKNEVNKGEGTLKSSKSGTAKSKSKSSDYKSNADGMTWNVQADIGIYAMGRTNQLIIKGFLPDLDKLRGLVKKLDTYIESTTKNYHFTYIDAAEIYPGLERLLNISRGYQRSTEQQENKHFGLTLLELTNSIILTGPPSAHRIMASTVKMADVPAPFEAGIIRTYKLENADASEVATIIRDLIGSDDDKKKTDLAKYQKSASIPDTESTEIGDSDQTGRLMQQVEARISVSSATNSVIVQTTTRRHRELEKLVAELDKRRRQVLIEAFIVEISTMDNFELGIELEEFNSTGIAFTSFGLSTIDPTTGIRNVIVSPGGTAAVLDPDTIVAIIKALQSNSNVRIQSAPRLLVNDNATGVISSVEEEPVTQINASETVATTSFSGFVEAGTQFTIVPHISEEDYLRVEYQIALNHFGTRSTDSSIPPPRKTTSIHSEATIPDGFTVIVGGMQNVNEIERIDKVPFLGDIPLLGLLFRSTITKKQYKTTYLFMTPSIMKNDNFSDLKNASQKAIDEVDNHNETDNSKTRQNKKGLGHACDPDSDTDL